MTTPKRPLEVGDLIRVYGFDTEDALKVFTRTVHDIMKDGSIQTDGGEYVHPKQCRRLVKKRKVRREWEGQWKQVEIADGVFRTGFFPTLANPLTIAQVVNTYATLIEAPKPKERGE